MNKQTFFKVLSCSALAAVLVFAAPSCKKDKDACDDVVCNAGGTCVDGTCVYSDPCAAVTCLNGSTCDNGVCLCPSGYEGADCGTEVRTKYFGTWQTVNEACALFSPGNYFIDISAGSSSVSSVIISNIYNTGYTVIATVDGTNITIASQPFSLGTIQGTGVLNSNTVSLSYSISFGGNTETCTSTVFTKQ